MKGGKKHIITTKIYTMNDGTTKEEVTERVEDAWLFYEIYNDGFKLFILFELLYYQVKIS